MLHKNRELNIVAKNKTDTSSAERDLRDPIKKVLALASQEFGLKHCGYYAMRAVR